MSLQRVLQTLLDQRAEAQQLRRRRRMRPLDAVHVEVEGHRCVNFASNNYLGLSRHPIVLEAMRNQADRSGLGSGSSGLICGYTDAHASAESAVAKWKAAEAAVLLPSGWQANQAAVQTLSAAGGKGGGVRFLMDRLCHASLVDAVRGSGQPFRVWGHNDLGKLRRLLGDSEESQLQVVVTESIFSMDGDAANLEGLAAVKQELPFVLLLDEAHGGGVYGPAGSGYAAERGLSAAVDVSVVTFSKAMGLVGGAVCASAAFCDALVNFGRAYIYSTSVPPALCAGIEAGLGVMRDEPWRQRRLREISLRVRGEVASMGLALPAGDSPIIPILLGDEEAALRAAERLLSRGLLAAAVRPPTVPRGGSRLRISLCSEHRDGEIERLLEELREMCL